MFLCCAATMFHVKRYSVCVCCFRFSSETSNYFKPKTIFILFGLTLGVLYWLYPILQGSIVVLFPYFLFYMFLMSDCF